MKRRFTRILAALVLLLFVAPPMIGWGQTRSAETFSYTAYAGQGTSGTGSPCSANQNGITIASTKAYCSTNHVKEYSGSQLTISSTDNTITSIAITFSGTSYADKFTLPTTQPGSYSVSGSVGTWNGTANVITLENTASAQARWTQIVVTYSGGSTPSTYTVTVTQSTGGTISATPTSAAAGTTITLTATPTEGYSFDSWSITPNTVEIINNQFTMPASNVTVSAQWTENTTPTPGGDLSLTFDLSSNPGDWPTSNSNTLTNYTYTLNNVDYVFALKNVKCNSGYLMMTYVAVLGLPAIEGYKLTKVVASNSGGCSTSTIVGISSSDSQANYIAGGEAQTWSTQSSSYTYNLTSTEENTMYYMYVTNKNAQVTQVALTYEAATAPAVATPTFNPAAGTYNAAQSVTISCETQGATIYYTTDGTAPTNASTQYNGAITVAETTTIKAIAYDGTDYSAVATATYTIELPLSTMDEIFTASSTAGYVYITFNNWVVSGASKRRAYVTDGTKGFPIYDSNNGLNFQAGMILSGTVQCYLSSNGGAAQVSGINASDFPNAPTGGEVTVNSVSITDLDPINTGSVVNLGQLTFNGTKFVDADNNEITPYNGLYDYTAFTNGSTYTVKGVYVYYNYDEILPRDADDIVEVQLPSFELEIEASNGTVDVYIGEEQQTGTDGSYQIPQGSIVTLTATPINGYHFVEWQVEAEEGTVSIINNQFTMPACYVLVQAVFEEIPTVVYYYSINGVDDEEYTEVPEGTIIQLASSQDINSDFTFAGWTTDPNDVSDILPAGSNFTMDDTYEFYAVYAKTVTGEPVETVVILDGDAPELTSTAQTLTLTENEFTYYSSSAKFQAIENGAENYFTDNRAILIGKKDAYLYNTTAFGQGITKFEVYANKGASTNVSVGVYFSSSAISSYDGEAENTWTATLSTADHVYDASSALPTGAKYFWYQVTNAYNSQVQFRITYTITPAITNYYTRVFYNETVEGDIDIIGPSIIPSGQILDMGEDGAIYNSIEATFIIEDGAELFSNYEVEAATLQKMVLSYDNDEGEGGWKVIASPLTSTVTATAVNNLIDATPANYGLFYYDEPNHMWYNYKQNQDGTNLHPGFSIEPGKGYLYAKNSDVMIEFVGEMSAAEDPYEISDLSHASTGANSNGFNLVGNPFTYTVYANQPFYIPSDDILATVDQYWTVGIAPGSGIMVQATEDNDYSVIFTRTAPAEPTKGSVQMTLSQSTTNRGGVTKLDKAIVSFNEGSKLGKFYFGESVANIYIPQGNEEYAIVSAEAQGELPVNFRASENGTYTLSMDVENMDMNYLHLIDNMTGMDIDLLQTPSYTFEAKVNDYESRFRLVFAANIEDSASAGSTAFAFFSNGSWIINNAGEATLQVVDLTGRILSSETVNGSVSTTINAVPGVYMLRLINGENVNVQKIVVR